jgi:hypothetical protein
MDLHKINFWKRLEIFVKDVQVNDAMSYEEKEMIIRIVKEQQYPKPDVSECEKLFSKLTDEQRLELISDYCKFCGCMGEIKIQIESLESEMQVLTNKVYGYSQYGRYPSESDWLEIIVLLNEWSNKRQQLIALQECLSAIVNNARSI